MYKDMHVIKKQKQFPAKNQKKTIFIYTMRKRQMKEMGELCSKYQNFEPVINSKKISTKKIKVKQKLIVSGQLKEQTTNQGKPTQ